ncbi:MAG: ABC transporter permease [Lactobacillaceae bacterium]|jgi:putative ABC transport system permease protein|nr:ABC transporter permease [Lactobacillaceae bacterium]
MIDTKTVFTIAIRAVKANKMRSVLTSLGIIIGVAAVIVMLGVGGGAQKSIESEIQTMGSNLLMVVSGATSSGGARGGFGSQLTLKLEDVNAIEKELNSVKAAAPSLNQVNQIVWGNQNWSTSVMGTDNRMFEVREWPIKYGRQFTETELASAAKVAILGQTVVEEIFGDIDPIDRMVKIKGMPFKVIGVLAERGQTGMGQDQDDVIYVPILTAQKKLIGVEFPGLIRMIMVKAVDTESAFIAEQEINQLLRQRHRIGINQDDDFTVRNLTQFMEMMRKSTEVMTILLGSIASISLLVGGIGIMNIMLVSVTERTREIGIRMAIGARAWDIRMQFLMESVVLSFIGGIIGIILGLVGAWAVKQLTSLNTSVPLIYILIPFTFSGMVGLIFGYYPAYKASLLNPINALRYE